jgi:hypothetical protein
MSAVPIFSIEAPAGTSASRSNADHEFNELNRLWDLATVEIMHAQLEYSELEGRNDVDDRVEAEAWLRLWRAEERQRKLAVLIDHRLDVDHSRGPAEASAEIGDWI